MYRHDEQPDGNRTQPSELSPSRRVGTPRHALTVTPAVSTPTHAAAPVSASAVYIPTEDEIDRLAKMGIAVSLVTQAELRQLLGPLLMCHKIFCRRVFHHSLSSVFSVEHLTLKFIENIWPNWHA